MKYKLNMPILDLFTALEEIASDAHDKIIQWGFTAQEYSNRPKQSSADPAKKAHRKMIQASRRRNRI